MFFSQLSLRTQILLIFALCLVLLGTASVFLNAYLIQGLKDDIRNRALGLVQEQGQRLSEEIARLTPKAEKQNAELADLKSDPRVFRQVEILLEGNRNVMAVCVVDQNGNVVLSGLGKNPDVFDVQQDAQGLIATVDPSDFHQLRVRLRRKHPKMRTVEVDVPRGEKESAGRVRMLVSESAIYRDLERASTELSRRLFTVVFSFVAVLALSIYLMSRLLKRHVRVLSHNQQLDRMAYVGTLASGLAHEIRNPLNAMSVNLSVAEEELSAGDDRSPEIVERALGLIQREVNRLNRSVTSFMAFAHPEAGPRERTALRPIVDEVLDLLSPRVDEAGVKVEVNLPKDAELEADFSGLRQVLYNVVLNAIQAMADSPVDKRRLQIGGRRESAQWFLWVRDTGPGVPEGEEDKVFEVFHSTKAAGSGFGLSIARAIIDSHDGDIRMRRAEGGGSQVEIILPETGRRKFWKEEA